MKHPAISLPRGTVFAPSLTIAAVAVMVSLALNFTQALNPVDAWLTSELAGNGWGETLVELPHWYGGVLILLVSFGLASAMLASPASWRRLVLWLSTVLVLLGWGPALALAGKQIDIAAPVVAAMISGVCALIYGTRHRLPCDGAIYYY